MAVELFKSLFGFSYISYLCFYIFFYDCASPFGYNGSLMFHCCLFRTIGYRREIVV